MCARFVVDQNVIFIILDPNDGESERDLIFRAWYDDGHGFLFYTNTGKYAEENRHHLGILEEYAEAGKANLVSEEQLSEAEQELRRQLDSSGLEIRSNDRHMLALSLAAEATILCTRDKALRDDFRNLDIDGKTRKVYPINSKIKERQIQFLEQNRCERVPPA